METEKIFYVYVDYRGDDGKPFYVGKGSEGRVKDLERNSLHTNIKNKHGIIREVIFETYSEQESFEKEIQLIGELQTHINHGNGGANFTLGGDGVSGYRYTKEQSEKLSKAKKKLCEDPERRKKMSELVKKLCEDPEHRKKISESSKKMWEDPEHRAIMSESSKKMWEDPEHREKISESVKKQWEDPEYRAMMKEKIKLGIQKKKLEKLQQEI
jgi:hypothetical protein